MVIFTSEGRGSIDSILPIGLRGRGLDLRVDPYRRCEVPEDLSPVAAHREVT